MTQRLSSLVCIVVARKSKRIKLKAETSTHTAENAGRYRGSRDPQSRRFTFGSRFFSFFFVFYCGNRDRDPLSQMRPQTGAEGGGAIHLSTPTTRETTGAGGLREDAHAAHTLSSLRYIYF